jgi:hypothetical protein
MAAANWRSLLVEDALGESSLVVSAHAAPRIVDRFAARRDQLGSAPIR